MTISLPEIVEWKQWVRLNLHRGLKPKALSPELRKRNIPETQIRVIFGDAYEAETDAVDYEAIANCAITRRAGVTPGVRKLHTKKAQVFTWDNFLSPEECQETIALMDQHLRPSTVTDDGGDARIRTSSTCDLGELQNPFIMDLDEKIAAGLGIHWSYSEANQGQKYTIGQEFKSHTDYFEPNTPEFLPNTGELGQRTWTFMIYLNSTPEGGATRFPRLDKLFRPREGLAVIWNNQTPEGGPNHWTLHHGMKPRKGEKYIITKWFREKGWGPMFAGAAPVEG